MAVGDNRKERQDCNSRFQETWIDGYDEKAGGGLGGERSALSFLPSFKLFF